MKKQRNGSARAVAKKSDSDLPSCLTSIEDLLLMIRRHYAAYMTLTRVVLSSSDVAAQAVGSPLFEFRASFDGVSVMPVVQDTEKLSARDRAKVCGVFARSQRASLVRAVAELENGLEQLKTRLLADLEEHGAVLEDVAKQPIGVLMEDPEAEDNDE